MCLLIVVRAPGEEFPVLVAGNRDERRDRKASPPGLWVGERHAVISPRDRVAGGTWLGVNDRLLLAGLTNVTASPPPPGASSRGHLVHLALDQDDFAAGLRAVVATVKAQAYGGFQLVLADGERLAVVRHAHGTTQVVEVAEPFVVLTNEHGPGELHLPSLASALAGGGRAPDRLQRLRPLLLERGGNGRHPALKPGGDHGTVSSTLLAVPAREPTQLLWLHASGAPDQVEYRNYGNLGRRLVDEAPRPGPG